LKREKMRQ